MTSVDLVCIHTYIAFHVCIPTYIPSIIHTYIRMYPLVYLLQCMEGGQNLPKMKFSFVTIAQLEQTEKDSLIGACVLCEQLYAFVCAVWTAVCIYMYCVNSCMHLYVCMYCVNSCMHLYVLCEQLYAFICTV